MFFESPSELHLLAYEIGRLSKTKRIYGIDNKMGYNYGIGDFIENDSNLENSIDPETYIQLTNTPFKEYPKMAERYNNYDKATLFEKLKITNEPIYLDHLMNCNADKLLYVGIDDGFQGADNAAIFYHRNMKIYSNLNRIKIKKEDRVFIIMGAAHTAF